MNHNHAPQPERNERSEPVPRIVRRHIGEHAAHGAGVAPIGPDMRPAVSNDRGQVSNVDPAILLRGQMEAKTVSMALPAVESVAPTTPTRPSWLDELPYGEGRPRPLTIGQIKDKLGDQTPKHDPDDFRNPDGSFNHEKYRQRKREQSR